MERIKEQIDSLVDRIKDFNEQMVQEDSDIDLCVITRERKKRIEIIRELRRAIAPVLSYR
jgi:predicted nucleotidyltransferase